MIGRGLKHPRFKGEDFTRHTLVTSKVVIDYFGGKGFFPVSESTPEQNARLWLWWFLGGTYFGDKGERLHTGILRYLEDFQTLVVYDWISPALGLLTRYMRDAVRPDHMDKGSHPSLVGPGYIMEVRFVFRISML